MSHGAPTVSARFIYGPTTTHDGSATIHHGGATNDHDASTIRYGASTIQAGSATVASRPPTNLHDLVVAMRQSRGGGGTLIFMPPKELWEAYSNRTVRPSVRQSVRPSVRPSRFRVRSISPIFFEVGIPNLVCGYILGWRSVAYHFRVTVTLTLTSDLVFRIIVSGAYLLYYLR